MSDPPLILLASRDPLAVRPLDPPRWITLEEAAAACGFRLVPLAGEIDPYQGELSNEARAELDAELAVANQKDSSMIDDAIETMRFGADGRLHFPARAAAPVRRRRLGDDRPGRAMLDKLEPEAAAFKTRAPGSSWREVAQISQAISAKRNADLLTEIRAIADRLDARARRLEEVYRARRP